MNIYIQADFFTLKELEKVAFKRKGIVSQSVKEVLQSLVDDNMVLSDKCGVQTVYWCLPSTVTQQRRAKLESLKLAIKQKEARVASLKGAIESLEEGREETAEKAAILASIEEKRGEQEDLKRTIGRFASLDPVAIRKMSDDIEALKVGADRWTDNIYSVQSWATNKFNMEKSVFNKQFDIPEELDYMAES